MLLSGIELAERGWVPDVVARVGIRRLTAQRLRREVHQGEYQKLLAELKASPIAIETEAANEQHYEVPAEFYRLCLGDNLKYSCAYFENGSETLKQAEEGMFELYVQRAQLADGMHVLDLGCGWGSLSLWLAARYPEMQITSVSNSAGQKQYIDATAKERGLNNIEVITGNVNSFDTSKRFDRVLSIEMFEHMRNYQKLLANISGWLKDDGKLFVHIFCHHTLAYTYEVDGEGDWMARHFFTGGTMPSQGLLKDFDDDLLCTESWRVGGEHYAKTAQCWLENLDAKKELALSILEKEYGQKEAVIQYNRWRLFFLACDEFFGWNAGREWGVCHYLFENR